MFRSLTAESRRLRTALATPTAMDDSTKQALLDVVQVWLDRLQTMTVITTFFVSIDSMLYGYASVALPQDTNTWSSVDLLKAATLGGAIILHACASILGYLTSFVLIRYRLEDAEEKVEQSEASEAIPPQHSHAKSLSSTSDPQSIAFTSARPVRYPSQNLRSLVSVYQVKPFGFARRCRVRAAKPNPETPDTGDAVALRTLQSMIHTLSRCHTVVAVMSNVGFVLALLGTIVYFWTALPLALGSFASVCLGGSLIAGVYAIM